MRHNSIADLTVSDLLRRMKLSHLYSVCGAVAAIITGAFALGMYVSNYKTERAQVEVINNREELTRAVSSHEFYTRFLRYTITKKQTEEDGYMRYETDHRKAKDMFVALIKTWYADQGKVGAQFVLTPSIHKSYDPAQSNITLPDGSNWPIPYEIKKEVLGLL